MRSLKDEVMTMGNTIFVGGVHGVGKTSFCDSIYKQYKVASYSASAIIAKKADKIKQRFSSDKRVEGISSNQDLLLIAVEELGLGDAWYMLDGHFCLIDKSGKVSRIPESTFLKLDVKGIIVLVDSVDAIVQRLMIRDGVTHDAAFIDEFQDKEVRYSKEIAAQLGVPHLSYTNDGPLDTIEGFFRNLCVIA